MEVSHLAFRSRLIGHILCLFLLPVCMNLHGETYFQSVYTGKDRHGNTEQMEKPWGPGHFHTDPEMLSLLHQQGAPK